MKTPYHRPGQETIGEAGCQGMRPNERCSIVSQIWKNARWLSRITAALAFVTAYKQELHALRVDLAVETESSTSSRSRFLHASNHTMETTASLGKHALSHRFRLYVSIIGVGVLFLLLAAAVIHRQRGGRLLPHEIHIWRFKIRFRAGQKGLFCDEVLLCCGPKPYGLLEGEMDLSEDAGEIAGKDKEAMDDLEPRISERLGAINQISEEEREEFRAFEEKQRFGRQQFLRARRYCILMLFALYVSTSVWIPYRARDEVSCQEGFYWETHMCFFAVFMLTKCMELALLALDKTINVASFFEFIQQFVFSFLGYADGYMDATAFQIAASCHHVILSQRLAMWMAIDYILGVVILQWIIVVYFAKDDPSHACIMKLVHMDALASCISLPDKYYRNVWTGIHLARTLGEDLWQAVLQTLYVIHVKQNYFMVASIIMGLCSSCKAVYDAYTRTAEVMAAYRAFLEDAEKAKAEKDAREKEEVEQTTAEEEARTPNEENEQVKAEEARKQEEEEQAKAAEEARKKEEEEQAKAAEEARKKEEEEQAKAAEDARTKQIPKFKNAPSNFELSNDGRTLRCTAVSSRRQWEHVFGDIESNGDLEFAVRMDNVRSVQNLVVGVAPSNFRGSTAGMGLNANAASIAHGTELFPMTDQYIRCGGNPFQNGDVLNVKYTAALGNVEFKVNGTTRGTLQSMRMQLPVRPVVIMWYASDQVTFVQP